MYLWKRIYFHRHCWLHQNICNQQLKHPRPKAAPLPSIDEPLGITVSQIKEDADTHHASPGLVLHFTNKRRNAVGAVGILPYWAGRCPHDWRNGTHPDPLNSKKKLSSLMMDHNQRAILLLVGCLIPPQSMDPQKNLAFPLDLLILGSKKRSDVTRRACAEVHRPMSVDPAVLVVFWCYLFIRWKVVT